VSKQKRGFLSNLASLLVGYSATQFARHLVQEMETGQISEQYRLNGFLTFLVLDHIMNRVSDVASANIVAVMCASLNFVERGFYLRVR